MQILNYIFEQPLDQYPMKKNVHLFFIENQVVQPNDKNQDNKKEHVDEQLEEDKDECLYDLDYIKQQLAQHTEEDMSDLMQLLESCLRKKYYLRPYAFELLTVYVCECI